MKKKFVTLGLVGLAVLAVLWFKPSVPTPSGSTDKKITSLDTHTKIILFADPREAGGSCGCAQIIRSVRGAGEIAGVEVQEFDSRRKVALTGRYGIRVSPTVIILDPGGKERERFEGESPETIVRLGAALKNLTQMPRSDRGKL